MTGRPTGFLKHLQHFGYHPRSDKHSNALALSIVLDLVENCEVIREKSRAGQIVFDIDFDVIVSQSTWNVDLVFGSPPLGTFEAAAEGAMRRGKPSNVEIAIELKSIMTEHRKAVKNRKRDLEAHHEHVHNYSSRAVAGGVFLINASETFKSPLRPETTSHRGPDKLVEHCVSELRSVSTRGGPTGYGLEAKCALVVRLDNIDASTTETMTRRPSPQPGDPLHYDSFIRTLCEMYKDRFG